MERVQKTQDSWQKEYESGELTPWALWKAGFRPRSNKYRCALKEYKYYGKYYRISITLSHCDYDELKGCGAREYQEAVEEEERAEYERFVYLQDKFGNK